jgi:RNA polymerase sigma-70 factor (ECF subfamily)
MTESLQPVSISAVPSGSSTTEYLISQCLEGEDFAYQQVYNLYKGPIYRLCYSILQHREDAEEVLQDTFEYAFRRLHRYDPNKASLKTWLYQIAISRCRNKRRRKWLPTIPISNILRDRLADKQTIQPDEKIVLDERQRKVWEALGHLSPKLRETAVLRYYEGLTYVEIGNILSIPAKTAESRMRLAHKALAQLLEEEFGLGKDGGRNESEQ